MKITDNSQSVVVDLSRYQKVQQPAAETLTAGGQQPANQVKSSDKVDISLSREKVDSTSNALKGPEEFRADRVAEVKARLEAGKYQVDSRDVAEKMIAAISKPDQR